MLSIGFLKAENHNHSIDYLKMKRFISAGQRPVKRSLLTIFFGMVFFMACPAVASDRVLGLSSDVNSALHYLIDLVRQPDTPVFEAHHIDPFLDFITSSKPKDVIYRADDTFDAPSAYNDFSIDLDLKRLADYTMDANIPSFVFWPSSLRLTTWTSVHGGPEQLVRLRAAVSKFEGPFVLRGAEHIAITPDQNTGTYFSYDIDKLIVFSPYKKGKVLITIQSQQAPSAVGKKGWVLGEDEQWSYLYTSEKGIGLKGLGWADTQMYDSFNVTVYYQADPQTPKVTCGSVSWVKAGWAGINMVKTKHIHRGLTRVASAFTAVMENPRLPEPSALAKTFSKTEGLPTPTLRRYTSDYFDELQRRLSASETVWKKVRHSFDTKNFLDQMTRDEMYATLALDYLKKVLNHNPVMERHPF